jgi:hypothetical protein
MEFEKLYGYYMGDIEDKKGWTQFLTINISP